MLCCVCKCRKRSDQLVGGSRPESRKPEKQHFDPNFPDETDVYDDDVDRGGGVGGGLLDRWVSTRDKMSVSEMRINYKLFDCLKREFADPAFVCNGCFDLLEQIDALQFQANELIRLLRTRIDYNLDGGDDPNLSDDTPVATFTKLGGGGRGGSKRSRGGGKSAAFHPSAKKQRLFKTEADDDDDDVVAEDGGDTGILDDPDFMLAAAKKRVSNPAVPSLSARTATSSSVKKETADKPFATKSTAAAATYQRDPNKRQVIYKNEFWDKANDEAYVRDIMSKKNFEYEVQLIDTISGHQHLIYDGAVWHAATFKSFTTEKYIMKWVCAKSHNNSYRCLARVATTSDNSAVISESRYIEHNHELDPEEVEDALLRNSVREITLNHPEMTPIRVFKTVQLMNGESNALKFTQKRQNAYLRYISRLQDKHGIPRKPRECKPGYKRTVRKKPLDKWKKTPTELKMEAEARAAAIAAGEELATVEDVEDLDDDHHVAVSGVAVGGDSQVQHIIIQPAGVTGAGQVILQQTTAGGVAVARPGQTFQIEYTGHSQE